MVTNATAPGVIPAVDKGDETAVDSPSKPVRKKRTRKVKEEQQGE